MIDPSDKDVFSSDFEKADQVTWLFGSWGEALESFPARGKITIPSLCCVNLPRSAAGRLLVYRLGKLDRILAQLRPGYIKYWAGVYMDQHVYGLVRWFDTNKNHCPPHKNGVGVKGIDPDTVIPCCEDTIPDEYNMVTVALCDDNNRDDKNVFLQTLRSMLHAHVTTNQMRQIITHPHMIDAIRATASGNYYESIRRADLCTRVAFSRFPDERWQTDMEPVAQHALTEYLCCLLYKCPLVHVKTAIDWKNYKKTSWRICEYAVRARLHANTQFCFADNPTVFTNLLGKGYRVYYRERTSERVKWAVRKISAIRSKKTSGGDPIIDRFCIPDDKESRLRATISCDKATSAQKRVAKRLFEQRKTPGIYDVVAGAVSVDYKEALELHQTLTEPRKEIATQLLGGKPVDEKKMSLEDVRAVHLALHALSEPASMRYRALSSRHLDYQSEYSAVAHHVCIMCLRHDMSIVTKPGKSPSPKAFSISSRRKYVPVCTACAGHPPAVRVNLVGQVLTFGAKKQISLTLCCRCGVVTTMSAATHTHESIPLLCPTCAEKGCCEEEELLYAIEDAGMEEELLMLEPKRIKLDE